MKRIVQRNLPVLSLVAAAALLAGCASGNANLRADASSYDSGYDYRKIAWVEGNAKAKGIEVVWVNPPKTSTTAELAQSN